MQQLHFPSYSFRLQQESDKTLIFDEFRKKWIILTPEEWVRQHVLKFMKEDRGYPASLTSVEYTIELNGLKRRCDILYHNNAGKPVLIVECKAPEVSIDQQVLDQAVRYNFALGVKYLFLTNGWHHLFAGISEDGTKLSFEKDILPFDSIS